MIYLTKEEIQEKLENKNFTQEELAVLARGSNGQVEGWATIDRVESEEERIFTTLCVFDGYYYTIILHSAIAPGEESAGVIEYFEQPVQGAKIEIKTIVRQDKKIVENALSTD